MEKYYGSSGRYTCNGYVPMSVKKQHRRRNRIYLSRLVIDVMLVLIIWMLISMLIWAFSLI